MDSQLAQIKFADGAVLTFEDDSGIPVPGERLVGIGSPPNIDIGTALETIKRAAQQLLETVVSLAQRPECELEFGVKLSAAAGAVLAKAAAEANFKVKLKWTAESATGKPDSPKASATS